MRTAKMEWFLTNNPHKISKSVCVDLQDGTLAPNNLATTVKLVDSQTGWQSNCWPRDPWPQAIFSFKWGKTRKLDNYYQEHVSEKVSVQQHAKAEHLVVLRVLSHLQQRQLYRVKWFISCTCQCTISLPSARSYFIWWLEQHRLVEFCLLLVSLYYYTTVYDCLSARETPSPSAPWASSSSTSPRCACPCFSSARACLCAWTCLLLWTKGRPPPPLICIARRSILVVEASILNYCIILYYDIIIINLIIIIIIIV